MRDGWARVHRSVGIRSHGSQISEQAGCPATDDVNPGQGGKRGGHGIGPYTGTRKRFWVLSADPFASARTPQPRAHRYNVPTPPSAQTGVSIHPGAAPAPMRESGLPSASLSTFSPHPNVAPQLPAPPTVRGRMPQRKRNVLHVNVCMPECPCCATTRGSTCRGYQRCWVAED